MSQPVVRLVLGKLRDISAEILLRGSAWQGVEKPAACREDQLPEHVSSPPLRFAPAPFGGDLFMKRWRLGAANLLAASTGCTSTALPIAACVPKATKSQHTCQPYCRQSSLFLPTDDSNQP
jgi:hypothetical protein